jgi:ATP-binding cassette, subfamily C (CFTR/MRP), member 1
LSLHWRLTWRGSNSTHFLDTTNSAATIRALGCTSEYIRANDKLVDNSLRATYIMAMIQQWLMFTINVVVAMLAALVIVLSTQVKSAFVYTGAGMVTLISLGEYLANVILTFTSLETAIGAVSRLKAFGSNTPSESPSNSERPPPESWPESGRIEIIGASASYQSVPTPYVPHRDGNTAKPRE